MGQAFEKPTYELAVDEMIRLSFNLYLSRPLNFVLPFLFAAMISAVTSILLPAPPMGQFLWSLLPAQLANLLLTSFTIGIVSSAVDAVTAGVAVKYASEILEGRTPTLNDVLTYALSKAISLLVARATTERPTPKTAKNNITFL